MRTDEQIRMDVIEEIKADPQLTKTAARIGVSVKNEVVTLTGTVDYLGQKLAAENAAQRVKNVKVVAVDIDIRTAHSGPSDSQIAEAVRQALVWHSAVNEDLVNIKVEDGKIYLDGVVDWDYERKAAEYAVEHLRGVRGVINHITIRKHDIDPQEVERRLKAAFIRHAATDCEHIQIKTIGNKVILSGTVRSWVEKEDATDAAWAIAGVSEVEDRLVIASDTYVH